MDVMQKALWPFGLLFVILSFTPASGVSAAFAGNQQGASCTNNGGSVVYLPNALTKRTVAVVGSGSCTGNTGGFVTVEILDNGRVVTSATRKCGTSRGRACQVSTTYIAIVKGHSYSARVTAIGAM